jgi:hypothetical protein
MPAAFGADQSSLYGCRGDILHADRRVNIQRRLTAYLVAPDSDARQDVYAVLREAVAKAGKTALARVVISQRERMIALRPMGDAGLMAHTLYEDRDLNSSKDPFDDLADIKIDPEMVQLATQLVQRQAGKSDAADLEDRYETRLRGMIDAKLKAKELTLRPKHPSRRPATSSIIWGGPLPSRQVAAWPAVMATREALADIVDIDLVAFLQSGMLVRPGAMELLEQALRLGAETVERKISSECRAR